MNHPDIATTLLVIHPDDHDLCQQALGELFNKIIIVNGGQTRQQSTLNGLRALQKQSPDFVHIHDGARPFVTARQISRLNEVISPQLGALLGLKITDTIKKLGENGYIKQTIDRDHLYLAQTPQVFPFRSILAAHEQAALEKRQNFTDDSSIAEWFNLPMRIIDGSGDNIKITWPQDILCAERQIKELTYVSKTFYPDIRVGNGYDVHPFVEGDFVTLCGIKIAHNHRLDGHSDADVALHALTDALLATCGAGDIGTHFPPSDEKWRSAPSDIFVRQAIKIIKDQQGRIANIDITLIAEEPRIGPHRRKMIENLQSLLNLEATRISVKATTNEKLGFVGRKEGIAAIATASVVFPGELPL